MSSNSVYASQIRELRAALCSLPQSLPSGATIYNFQGWVADLELLDTYGAECSVLNAQLESVFGLRAQAPIAFLERGPGIDSLADLIAHYLLGDYAEKEVLVKWAEDLTEAAELAAIVGASAKRVSKPSAALKRSQEYLEDVAEQSVGRKRIKQVAVEREEERQKACRETAQKCNWKLGFDDLKDTETGPKLYTTGRRGYSVVTKLFVDCRSISTGKALLRCSAPECRQTWTARNARRIIGHAASECRFIEPALREEAAAQGADLALGSQVEELDENQPPTSPVTSDSPPKAQPSVFAVASTEGRRAKQVRFDLAVLNFVSAAQLAPAKVDLLEFHTMISILSPVVTPKHSSYIAQSQIPMESARLRRQCVLDLKKQKHLTISYDGGSTIRPQSFTTIHVTVPDSRIAYLMEGIEASGVSHTGVYYFDEIDKHWYNTSGP